MARGFTASETKGLSRTAFQKNYNKALSLFSKTMEGLGYSKAEARAAAAEHIRGLDKDSQRSIGLLPKEEPKAETAGFGASETIANQLDMRDHIKEMIRSGQLGDIRVNSLHVAEVAKWAAFVKDAAEKEGKGKDYVDKQVQQYIEDNIEAPEGKVTSKYIGITGDEGVASRNLDKRGGFGAKETKEAVVPKLGAPGTSRDLGSNYPESRGARADLAAGKSTQEIKKMISDDFKSKEAKEMGFLGIKSATASRRTMDFKVKTDLVPPASMKDKGRAYDVIVNAKGGASFINPPATDDEMKFAEKYREKAKLARTIAGAYDVDRSDVMTDYFDFRYMISSLTLTDKDGNDIV